MYNADALIEKIVGSAQIPSGKRRQEITRELRAHIDDFVSIAEQGGHSDDELEKLVAANFGDTREIAEQFAWVYRRERAICRISVFLLSTVLAAGFISAAVLALQAGMAIGLGVPVPRVLGGRHLTYETLYILSTVAAYVGLISLEKLFDRGRFQKATASLALVFAVLVAGFAIANAPGIAEVLISGFASGLLLRAIQVFVKRRAARIGAVLGCFGLFGLVSACKQSADLQKEALLKLAVWVAIGVCCHLMTHVAARMDRAPTEPRAPARNG